MNHGEFGRKCSEGLLGHIKSHFETHVQVKLNQVPNEEKPQNIFKITAYTGNMILVGIWRSIPKCKGIHPMPLTTPTKKKPFFRDDEAPWSL